MTIIFIFMVEMGFQVIAAEGEQKASRALREAAEVIAESPSALQVNPGWKRKYLLCKSEVEVPQRQKWECLQGESAKKVDIEKWEWEFFRV